MLPAPARAGEERARSTAPDMPSMLALVPALAVCLCAVVLRAPSRGPGAGGWRGAIVLASLAAAAWAVLGAELLSLANAFAFVPVFTWWAVPIIVLGAIVRARNHSVASVPARRRPPDLPALVIAGGAGSIVVATGLMALLTPPSTWDALAYHLPRQVHWIQQGSIAHFPAHDLRQLEMPPLAEILGAHLMILDGSDRWANAVQWWSFAGAGVAASLVARDLGAPARAQAVAALVLVANPAAAVQAFNAKNDLVVAFIAVALAWLAVRIRLERSCPPGRILMVGIALGLLLLSKGTGCLLALPLAAVLGLWMLAHRPRRALLAGLAIGLIAFALNAGHWSRNLETFGHPLGKPARDGGYALVNEAPSPGILASNLLRNLALHTGLPWPVANAVQYRAIRILHEAIGQDLNDPRSTLLERFPFSVQCTLRVDGSAGAPFHVLLGAVVLAAMLLAPRRVLPGRAALICAVPFAGFVLFCAVLKWQPWHARLHIPILALLAPVASVILARLPGDMLKGAVLVAAAALAWVAILFNVPKPLLGPRTVFGRDRLAILFQNQHQVREAACLAAASAARFKPRTVAFDFSRSPWEYPVLRVFLDRIRPAPYLRNLRPNFGPRHPESLPPADVVVVAGDAALRSAAGCVYVAVAQHLPFTVYVRHDLSGLVALDPESTPFVGYRVLEGLDPPQGPYPQWDLPVVRWGTGRRTRLAFDSDARPAELTLDCRRNDTPDQALTVRLNGREIYRFAFGPAWAFTRHRVPLKPGPGRNELVIEYANCTHAGSPQERAVLYRGLRILPEREQ